MGQHHQSHFLGKCNFPTATEFLLLDPICFFTALSGDGVCSRAFLPYFLAVSKPVTWLKPGEQTLLLGILVRIKYMNS